MSRAQQPVAVVTTEAEFFKRVNQPGMTIVDAYAKWAGSCEAVVSCLRQLKTERGDAFNFFQAETDSIPAIESYQNTSRPTFLVFFSGVLVNVIRGVDTPKLEAVVASEFALEESGAAHTPFVDGTHVVGRPKVAGGEMSASDAAAALAALGGGPVETTFAVIKPDGMNPWTQAKVMEALQGGRFNILAMRKVWLTTAQAEQLYAMHQHQTWFHKLVAYISSGPIVGIYMARENAIAAWRALMGPGNSQRAHSEAPQSIRAKCGIDSIRNAVHGSDTAANVELERAVVFGSDVLELPLPDVLKQTEDGAALVATLAAESRDDSVQRTVCLCKPDLIGKGPKALAMVLETAENHGFDVLRQETLTLHRAQALDLYKDVQDSEPAVFQQTVDALTEQPSTVLLLKGTNAVARLLELAGPANPDTARQEAPMSLRARLGTDAIRNALLVSSSVEAAQAQTALLLPRGTSSRQLKTLEHTLALIKPDAVQHREAILARAQADGFVVVKEETQTWTRETAEQFYGELREKPFFEELVTWLSGGEPLVALVLERENAVLAWRDLAGPTDAAAAREASPHSLRAAYGSSGVRNAVHGSESVAAFERETALVFGQDILLQVRRRRHALGSQDLLGSQTAVTLGPSPSNQLAMSVKHPSKTNVFADADGLSPSSPAANNASGSPGLVSAVSKSVASVVAPDATSASQQAIGGGVAKSASKQSIGGGVAKSASKQSLGAGVAKSPSKQSIGGGVAKSASKQSLAADGKPAGSRDSLAGRIRSSFANLGKSKESLAGGSASKENLASVGKSKENIAS